MQPWQMAAISIKVMVILNTLICIDKSTFWFVLYHHCHGLQCRHRQCTLRRWRSCSRHKHIVTIVSTVIVVVTAVLVCANVMATDVTVAIVTAFCMDTAVDATVVNAKRSLRHPCDDNLNMHSRPNFMNLLQCD